MVAGKVYGLWCFTLLCLALASSPARQLASSPARQLASCAPAGHGPHDPPAARRPAAGRPAARLLAARVQ